MARDEYDDDWREAKRRRDDEAYEEEMERRREKEERYNEWRDEQDAIERGERDADFGHYDPPTPRYYRESYDRAHSGRLYQKQQEKEFERYTSTKREEPIVYGNGGGWIMQAIDKFLTEIDDAARNKQGSTLIEQILGYVAAGLILIGIGLWAYAFFAEVFYIFLPWRRPMEPFPAASYGLYSVVLGVGALILSSTIEAVVKRGKDK